MAEEIARAKQYEYKALSNLVLQPDRSLISRRSNEPSGEPETLWGKVNPQSFGDRVLRTRPKALTEKLDAIQQRQTKRHTQIGPLNHADRSAPMEGLASYGSVLQATEDLEGLRYQPKTRATRLTYELLLNFVQQCLGDQPQDVIRGATDEILVILKNEEIKEPTKKKQVEEILDTLNSERFNQIYNLARKITDYHTELLTSVNAREEEEGIDTLHKPGNDLGGLTMTDTLDEDMGVAVVFDEDEDGEEEEEEEEQFEVQREEDLEEDREQANERIHRARQLAELEEATAVGGAVYSDVRRSRSGTESIILGQRDREEGRRKPDGSGTVSMFPFSTSEQVPQEQQKVSQQVDLDKIDPLEIDAFWLQRQLGKYYTDALQSQQLSKAVLEIFADARDMRECENRLVLLLNYDKFDLIKRLIKNRFPILYCTRLGQAQSKFEKEKIREEMSASPELLPILKALLRREGAETNPSTEIINFPVSSAHTEASPSFVHFENSLLLDENLALDGRIPQILDLDSLIFDQGGHVMTNKRCELPEGSTRSSHKGYEEISIPAPKPKPLEEGERLVLIQELPEWTRDAFKGMKALNRIQSRVCNSALHSDENLLLCAPTGAGKTNVALLTILREVGKYRDLETEQFDRNAFKVIYIAPMKALVQEMVGNFTVRLGATTPYNLRVEELTGDAQLSRQQMYETQILVTTPEKWDIVTRKALDKSGRVTEHIHLVIIDEIHLLHDDRGPVLESLVARILGENEMRCKAEKIRLVGLSATLPNYADVGKFLRVNPMRGLFYFDHSFRPCPLTQKYVGITEKKPLKRYQLMNKVVYNKTAQQAGKNQVLIFVHSRKETARTARALRDICIENETVALFLHDKPASREVLVTEAESGSIKSSELREVLPYGFAIHHAGMTRSDRTLVEDLFADGHIQVLVSTATLAWGVNLPAHTVIIKGTQIYSPERGRWTEISPQDILQMLGRAGRPQFDVQGEGIIITSHTELQYYLSLLNQQLPIESQLLSRLVGALNAEIVLGHVSNRWEACEWLSRTYLYVRMLRSPSVYGLTADDIQEAQERDPSLIQRRLDLVHSAACTLAQDQLILYNEQQCVFESTELGRISSHYYISHTSMNTYLQHLQPHLTDLDLLRVFALSEEFKHMPVREEEKLELSKLLERVPIPVKESVDESTAKINVLLQAYISQLKLDGFALMADMIYVTQSAGRILRALFEIALIKGWSLIARRLLTLCLMVTHRMWTSMSSLRQFKGLVQGLTDAVIQILERKDIAFDRLMDLNPQELGELVRQPKHGRVIHRCIHLLPKLNVQIHVQPLTRSMIRMQLKITSDFQYDEMVHSPAGELFWIFIEDGEREQLLHYEMFLLKPAYMDEEHHVTCQVPLFDPVHLVYFITLMSDRWLGSVVTIPVSFKKMFLPEKSPPPTELLDLQRIPVDNVLSALVGDDSEKIKSTRPIFPFAFLNALQTQLFHALISNDSLFIGALSGSGKRMCGQIALIQHVMHTEEQPTQKSLWLCMSVARMHEMSTWLKENLCAILPWLRVSTISFAEASASDILKQIDVAHVILVTPHAWDKISRRWKQRRSLQQIRLLVIEDLHFLGNESLGPTIEIILSRMRYIAAQTQQHMRVIALSTALSNARDVSEWLGCTQIFNFSPTSKARSTPLELDIQGVNVSHVPIFYASISRHLFQVLLRRVSERTKRRERNVEEGSGWIPANNALVFTPSAQQAKQTALDLLVHCQVFCRHRMSEEMQNDQMDDSMLPEDEMFFSPFLNVVQDKNKFLFEKALAQIIDQVLKTTLAYGIAVYHETLSYNDQTILKSLFSHHLLKLMVVSRECISLLSTHPYREVLYSHVCFLPSYVKASTVILLGTQFFNGHEHCYMDYPIEDILEMIGHAGDSQTFATISNGPSNSSDDSLESNGFPSELNITSPSTTGNPAYCLILCPLSKKTFIRRQILHSISLESYLHQSFHDHMNAEIIAHTIESQEDAVDYLTWSFLYRRISRNPNFYHLSGVTPRHLSEWMSESVEGVMNELVSAQCVEITSNRKDEEKPHIENVEDANISRETLSPQNLGMISSYYYLHYNTIELFSLSLSAKTRLRALLEVITSAHEIAEVITVRHNEQRFLRNMYAQVPIKISMESPPFHDIHTKAFILLQAHLCRWQLPMDLEQDRQFLVYLCIPLLQTVVDVLSSQGFLIPALAAMELSQLVVQAMLDYDSELKQLPHITAEILDRCEKTHVRTILDLIDLDDPTRDRLLDVDQVRKHQVAVACNRYPSVDVQWDLSTQKDSSGAFCSTAGESLTLSIQFTHESVIDFRLPPVIAPFFPDTKEESWWIVIGDKKANSLLGIKRVVLSGETTRAKMEFNAPDNPGEYTLFCVCDSYVGCDQEWSLQFQ